MAWYEAPGKKEKKAIPGPGRLRIAASRLLSRPWPEPGSTGRGGCGFKAGLGLPGFPPCGKKKPGAGSLSSVGPCLIPNRRQALGVPRRIVLISPSPCSEGDTCDLSGPQDSLQAAFWSHFKIFIVSRQVVRPWRFHGRQRRASRCATPCRPTSREVATGKLPGPDTTRKRHLPIICGLIQA
jgi:hypothetical protein